MTYDRRTHGRSNAQLNYEDDMKATAAVIANLLLGGQWSHREAKEILKEAGKDLDFEFSDVGRILARIGSQQRLVNKLIREKELGT